MKITQLKTNRIKNPLGFDLGKPSLSYIVTETDAKKQVAAQIEVALTEDFNPIVFDSGKSTDIDSLAYELSLELQPTTRYYWRVTVWAENGETATSEPAWFETAKLDETWQAKWITPDFDKDIHPVLMKDFFIDKKITSARAYVTGLGLYELIMNGRKVGDEYLSPNFNAYNQWIQYQTYDVTDYFVDGTNTIEVLLGNGLYKGRFGFDGGASEIYGDQFAFIGEWVLTFEDGSTQVIRSDETWQARKSNIQASGIYDGEVWDERLNDGTLFQVRELDLGYERLNARLSLPVVKKETIQPVAVLQTPAGETVLDFGQNMVGWVEFKANAPKGAEIQLEYGELLQEGNFYRENLRTAKAAHTYISNGEETLVRPYFTFYGFRYVKVTGWPGEVNPDDFIAYVLYSDMEQTGSIETSNPLVNRLFLNALWGQKGNFLDVPTDCPQRDERMGWTGDAQVFSGTACFNMDSYAFFKKYGFDLWKEQEAKDGMVPMVVPAANLQGGGSSAWGDAATIIPWNVYLHYGDKQILVQQFDSMKAWVDFIKRADDESGARRLWTTGFHFGDWLALDGEDPSFPTGGTEVAFISSAYYYYSANIVAKAARVLGKMTEAERYEALAAEVKQAIQDEYFTKTGRLALQTQTALVVALFMDLVPAEFRERIAADLRAKLKADKNHLKTGFVGTPYLCRALSENGNNDLAYTLLLNKDYPSWLYAVTMGATTIWERWNSVLPDGKISGTDMNSLNHYAYGSIVEWMYRHMAGLNPVEDRPGFRHVKLAPQPNSRLSFVKASLESAVGLYESAWQIAEDGRLEFSFTIPFNASATLALPDANLEAVFIDGTLISQTGLSASQLNETVQVELSSGVWNFNYAPTRAYQERFNTEFALSEILANEEARAKLINLVPQVAELPNGLVEKVGHLALREVANKPFLPIGKDVLERLDVSLSEIVVSYQ